MIRLRHYTRLSSEPKYLVLYDMKVAKLISLTHSHACIERNRLSAHEMWYICQ